jgi:uncharacterized repeat protein (TIGR03803 family)
MTAPRSTLPLCFLLTIIFCFALGLTAAQTLRVLHNFGVQGDGANPQAGMIFDSQGNLYGTTQYGGVASSLLNCSPGCGTVFQLTPNGDGTWNESLIYQFKGGYPGMGWDGAFPQGPLTLAPDGTLYGWTGCSPFDCYTNIGGLIFRLLPAAGGWREQIFYYLTNPAQYGGGCTGATCWVNFDRSGRIFSALPAGGQHGGGVLDSFGASSPRGAPITAIHQFAGGNNDGYGAYSSLTFDASDNIYGTTSNGGNPGSGTVFELSPAGGGNWSLKLLYSFYGMEFGGNADGYAPNSGVLFGPDGNLYGTTSRGGFSGGGTAFQLTPNPDGTWTEHVIWEFNGNQAGNGSGPGPLTVDATGNLYGTAQYTMDGYGLVFRLSQTSGQWVFTVLHDFTNAMDGASPTGGVALDPQGNLYGTTVSGGTHQQGVAYEIVMQ